MHGALDHHGINWRDDEYFRMRSVVAFAFLIGAVRLERSAGTARIAHYVHH
jgi:hypothetical protein